MPTLRHLALCALTLGPVAAHAQHGASDERVSLPEGPGSLEGIGDNASIKANMGSMTYGVPIEVPAGFPAVTPSLSLAYDSSGPSGVMGIGWDLAVPYVERMTNWGLPHYTAGDDFVAGGQIVHVGDGVYRDRFEKRFARHTWHDRGDGTQGYWTTELPDGTVQYFGATADGELVDDARVAGRGGATFRYHLVEQVDKFGHAMRLDYRTYDGLPHLDRVSYIFTGSDGGPGASLTFEYADRPDVLTDARSGATERRTQRLTAVNVFSKDVRLWRYTVHYEDEAISGGFSRVRRIDRVGLDETPHPVAFDFEYSQTLGNGCDADCDQPYLVDMGSLGINLAAGDATLADMNGDALPDIIDTSREGAHRIFVNTFVDRDQHAFELPVDSATGDRASHQLSSPYVQTLDANGDGRVDLVNVRTGEVLYNLGTGDWAEVGGLGDTADLPDFGDDFAGGAEEPTHVRFFDYDNDRRIDVLRSTLDQTIVYANMGQAGFAVVDDLDPIGAGFDSGLEMADMNGDGLQDAVRILPGSLSYRANLGFGRWAAWIDIEDLPFNEAERDFVELQDINGDSLDDLVIVLGDQLRFALNRAGQRFDAATVIEEAGGRALPTRVDGTTVLFADMNGSGSDDVVWISPQGDVTYLELFPVRPNLLTRLTNGLGLVTEVTYTTLVEERARAEEPWAYALPFPMLMARTIDTYDSLNARHQRKTNRYRDAFYDTEEKAYRGFAMVSTETAGDEDQDAGLSIQRFDVGAEDRYRNGLLLDAAQFAAVDGALTPLNMSTTVYDDCPVSGAEGADGPYAIRYLCSVATETVLQEGAPEAEWATTRTEYTYDGYGNVTLEAKLGVIAIGGGGCPDIDRAADDFGAPAGAACEGDEWFTHTAFVDPAGLDRWLLRLTSHSRAAGTLDSERAVEFVYHYDGEGFVGLPLGEATLGLLTRSRQRVDASNWIDALRVTYDDHGKPIESLNPRGFARRIEYDDEHLLVTRTDEELVAPDGSPYSLRIEAEYDPIWGVPSRATDAVVIVDGAPVTPVRWRRFTYDPFGRPLDLYGPEDPDGRPTTTYTYEDGDPVSRVITESRSVLGSATPDVRAVQCFDGFSRPVAHSRQSGPGAFEATDYKVYNRRGKVVATYRGHHAESDDCALEAPDTPVIRQGFDALGRLRGAAMPDASIHGAASTTRIERSPLSRAIFDGTDNDPELDDFDTPTVHHEDGLQRRTATAYVLPDRTLRYAFTYDVIGNLKRVTDPGGIARHMVWDRVGRVIESTDADRGTRTYEYDAAGNRVRVTDGAGRVTVHAYDGRNRRVATWDEADPDGTRVDAWFDLPGLCPAGACENTAGKQVGARFALEHGDGFRWFTYDALGNRTGIRTVIDGVPFDVTTTYDNLSAMAAMRFPDGGTVEYTRDGMGRVVSVDDIAPALTYRRGAILDTMTLGNGTQVAFDFDAMERLSSKAVIGADGEELLGLGYERDRRGFITRVTERDPRPDQPSASADYTFDPLGRLVSAVLDPDRDGIEETLSYAYDDSQRLIERISSKGAASPSHTGTLQYPGDRFGAIETDAHILSYDDAGMMISKNGQAFEWDHQGRLVGTRADGVVSSRIWNGWGDERVMIEEGARVRYSIGTFFEIEDGIARSRIYLGSLPVATRESGALATAILSDVAPAGAPDDRIDTGDAVLAARVAAGEAQVELERSLSPTRRLLRASVRLQLLDGETRTTWLHTDHYKNTVATTDEAGAMGEQRRFGPHGKPRAGTSEGKVWSDKQLDRTGLVFFGARYYDPDLGRWASPDPRFNSVDARLATQNPGDATDAYQFNRNNPIVFSDPDGRTGAIESAVKILTDAMKATTTGVDVELNFADASQRAVNLVSANAFTTTFATLGVLGETIDDITIQLNAEIVDAVTNHRGTDITAARARAQLRLDVVNAQIGLPAGASIKEATARLSMLTHQMINAKANLQGALTRRSNFEARGGAGNTAQENQRQARLARQRAETQRRQQRQRRANTGAAVGSKSQGHVSVRSKGNGG